MSARILFCRAFASAVIVLAAIGVAPMPAAALPDFRVQLFTTPSGTFDFAQGAAPVSAGPTTIQGAGVSSLTASGFARRGAVGGDAATLVVGTCCINTAVGGGSFAQFVVDDLIFSGPATEVSTRFNFRVDGTFQISDSAKTAAIFRLDAGFIGQGFSGRAALGNQFESPSGLLQGIPWPADGIHADITTPVVTLPTGVPQGVFLAMTLTVGAATFIPGESLSASGEFANTISFPLSGPVFDLPPGFTANAPSGLIVNNQWVGAPQAAPQGVPEPATLTLLGLGVGGLVAASWRKRS